MPLSPDGLFLFEVIISMSDNKKYYYLKLKENFFESDTLILLESQKDGYLYSNILLKLYLRSLKNEGRLAFNNLIPYNVEMLATLTRHQVGTVEKALRMFEQLGLIEILDNGVIYMTDIQNFIGKSSSEADRQREYQKRITDEKQKLLEPCKKSCKKSNKKNTPEIELEIETEIETEIDKKRKNKKTEYDVLIENYTDNIELRSTIYEFIKMRKGIKKPITSYGLKKILNELDRLAANDDEKIQILDKSIERSWAGVFELNNNGKNNKEPPKSTDPKESYKGKTIYEMTPEEREAAYEEGWDDV